MGLTELKEITLLYIKKLVNIRFGDEYSGKFPVNSFDLIAHNTLWKHKEILVVIIAKES